MRRNNTVKCDIIYRTVSETHKETNGNDPAEMLTTGPLFLFSDDLLKIHVDDPRAVLQLAGDNVIVNAADGPHCVGMTDDPF